MAKHKQALVFARQDYYTLQEACNYLNLKYETDNLNAKKLLQDILKYLVDIYIHVNGFDVQANFETVSLKNLSQEQKQHLKSHLSYANYRLSDLLRSPQGLFLRLCDYDLDTLRFSNKIVSCIPYQIQFDGVLQINQLNDDPKSLVFLDDYLDRNMVYNLRTLTIQINIDTASFNIGRVKEKVSLKFDTFDLFDIPLPSDEIQKVLYPHFSITADDLIVLHKDLELLENSIFNSKSIMQDITIKTKVGKSPQKILAQEKARIIAKEIWDNDTENKIRIKEMCYILYSELHKDHKDQLPCDQISMKDWIKDIAPTYARKGGRPKKT